jgi:hypothetical protein
LAFSKNYGNQYTSYLYVWLGNGKEQVLTFDPKWTFSGQGKSGYNFMLTFKPISKPGFVGR